MLRVAINLITAIDEATRFRVRKLYDHSTTQSAVDFIDQVRRALPMAIQRIQTDHGSERDTVFTWHLNELGIVHKRIPVVSANSAGSLALPHSG